MSAKADNGELSLVAVKEFLSASKSREELGIQGNSLGKQTKAKRTLASEISRALLLEQQLQFRAECARQLVQRATSSGSGFKQPFDVNVRIMTFNVAECLPRMDLAKLFGGSESSDIIAIGLQEVEMNSKSLLLEQTEAGEAWLRAIQNQLSLSSHNYVTLAALQLVGLWIGIFAKSEHQPYVHNIRHSLVRCGTQGMGNKGAIAVRFTVYCRRLCFIVVHFAPHEHQNEHRNANWRQILRNLRFELPPYADDELDMCLSSHDRRFAVCEPPHGYRNMHDSAASVTELFDAIFCFGDLNFRLAGLNYAQVIKGLQEDRKGDLFGMDQLRHELRTNASFFGWQEGEVNFDPTFKFDKGTDNYDTSPKMRPPAWTDRILWYVGGGGSTSLKARFGRLRGLFVPRSEPCEVKQLSYKSVVDIRDSDHRPVIADFSVRVQRIAHQRFQMALDETLTQLESKGIRSPNLASATAQPKERVLPSLMQKYRGVLVANVLGAVMWHPKPTEDCLGLFCVVCSGPHVFQTTAIPETANLDWNDTFVLPWMGADDLHLLVFRQHALSANELCGWATVALTSADDLKTGSVASRTHIECMVSLPLLSGSQVPRHVVEGVSLGLREVMESVKSGVTGVWSDSAQGVKEGGTQGLAKGFGKGMVKLVWNPVKATALLTTKTATGIANTPATILGGGRARPLPETTPQHVGEGLKSGLTGFASSLQSGVEGLLRKPKEEAQRSKSPSAGFIKGVGAGVAGLVYSPVEGVVKLATKTIEGAINTPEAIAKKVSSSSSSSRKTPTPPPSANHHDASTATATVSPRTSQSGDENGIGVIQLALEFISAEMVLDDELS